jgi:hypothetical protein
MFDDFVAAVPGEVEIDVGELGELHALAVEEALEAEAEAEGADVADAEEVADEAAGGGAAGEGGDAAGVAPFDQIGEDEEVAGIADLFNDGEFAAEALEDLRRGGGAVAAIESGADLGAEELDGVVAREAGEADVAEIEVELAAFGDAEGVAEGLGEAAEVAGEFFGRVPVVAAGGELGGVGLAEEGEGAHGLEDVELEPFAGFEIADVGGGGEGDAATAGEFDEEAGEAEGVVVAGVDLEGEVRAEDFLESSELRFARAAAEDGLSDGAAGAGEADEAFVEAGEFGKGDAVRVEAGGALRAMFKCLRFIW